MNETAVWAAPLLLLPGVGLLVMSTASRFEAVHGEVHHLLTEAARRRAGEPLPDPRPCLDHVVRRTRLLRAALVLLYTAAALLSGAGLAAALPALGAGTANGLLATSVAGIFLASLLLIRDAWISAAAVEDHARSLSRSLEEPGPGPS